MQGGISSSQNRPDQNRPERKLLLTGATGFVGRNLLLQILRSPAQPYSEIWLPVRSIDKFRTQLRQEGFETLSPALRPFRAEGPHWNLDSVPAVDHVVHSAAVLFSRNLEEYRRANVESTRSLLTGLRGNPRFVILSSQAAAGPCAPGQVTVTESDAESPMTDYGRTKLEMERTVHEEFPSVEYLFLRPPWIMGPRDLASLPLHQMTRGIGILKPGLSPKVYSVLSVNDLVTAIRQVLESPIDLRTLPRRSYFVAHPEPVTDRELFDLLLKVSDSRRPILPVPGPVLWGLSQLVDRIPFAREKLPSLTRDRVKELFESRWVISPELFQKTFNWAPAESVEQTLRRARDWYIREGLLG